MSWGKRTTEGIITGTSQTSFRPKPQMPLAVPEEVRYSYQHSYGSAGITSPTVGVVLETPALQCGGFPFLQPTTTPPQFVNGKH
jgi:hypothetical protein